MRWFIYNVLFAVGYLLMLPRFLARMWRRGGYRRGFLQRFGMYSAGLEQRLRAQRPVWVHAVSVGEVFVATRLIDELRALRPELAFVLSTTTSTGYRMALDRIGGRDPVLYFPVDFPAVVRRVLRIVDPLALVLIEGELWPNLLRLAHARRIPICLVNGRISRSSYRGYRRIRTFFAEVLQCMDLCLVQTEGDRQRLLELGAPEARVRVAGSAKYDGVAPDERDRERAQLVLEAAGFTGCRILCGGSTWPGEEDALLRIFRKLSGDMRDLRLILVPRHAERRPQIEAEIRRHELPYVLRSELEHDRPRERADVLLVDTTGELMRLYACATVIFVGKSLTAHGGQNVIEPAAWGKAVVVGPNMENFPGIIEELVQAGAVIQVRDEQELEQNVRELLGDEGKRALHGRRAAEAVEARKGVLHESAQRVSALILAEPG